MGWGWLDAEDGDVGEGSFRLKIQVRAELEEVEKRL